MRTRISSEGQVILPAPIMCELGLRAGDSLEASIEGGRIVLAPQSASEFPKIIRDPVTGIPAVDFGPDAPILTSEMVREMLADLP
jgi:AbrB family looped-hinge helix DNA binding protein